MLKFSNQSGTLFFEDYHHILLIGQGKVVEQAPVEEIFENPKGPYIRGLTAAAFKLKAGPL